jgi:tetratricopeptide (TPR) repeat protein
MHEAVIGLAGGCAKIVNSTAIRGHISCARFAAMAIRRDIKSLVIVAFLTAFSGFVIAATLMRHPQRDLGAPEAWAALERRDPERAASLFKQQLRQRPQDPALHFGAASAALALGKPASAVTSLRKAVELDPEFAEAHMLLAQVAYERGNTELAIRSIEKASSLRPRDRSARELLDTWRRESAVHSTYVEKPAGHFRILYEGGTQPAIGERVGRVLEQEYSRVGRALNSFSADPVTVILYTNREFHDITRSPAWATGSYDGRIRIAVGGSPSFRELDRVVTHELVHAIIASAAPRRVPAWLNEGLATYLESNDTRWTAHVLRNAASVMPLESLAEGFGGLDGPAAQVAYAESAIAAEILCAQLGSNIGAFLQSVGTGRSVDDALMDLHVQPNAFHAEWRRRVGLR